MNKKKIMSLIMALVMLVGVFSPLSALAAGENGTPLTPLTEAEEVTKSVTIHKMLLSKEDIKLKGRRVTVNIAKENEKDNYVTKFVVQKLEKVGGQDKNVYYADGTKLNENNETDKLFIQNYGKGEAVFGGTTGLDGTKYDGNAIKSPEAYFGKGSKEIDKVYFAWQDYDHQKVTKADLNNTELAYLKTENPEVKEGDLLYIKGTAGNLSKPDTKVVEKKVATKTEKLKYTTKIDNAFGGVTTTTGVKFDTSDLPAGKYLIQEIKDKSTYIGEEYYKKTDKKHKKPLTKKIVDGQVKYYDGQTEVNSSEVKTVKVKSIVDQRAVPVDITLPLVNEKGVVTEAHVYPKNVEDKPEIDKNFTKDNNLKEEKKTGENKAGDSTDPANKDKDPKPSNIKDGARYENAKENKARATANVGDKVPYEVKTKIAAGTSYENLTWNDIMTNGLTYNKDLKITATNGVTFEEKDYELVQDDNGFRLKLNKSGLEKIEKVTKAKDAEQKDVEITLTYSATINGTAKVDHPEKNNVTLEYGHKPGKDLKEKPVKPKNGELKVTKNFEDGVNTDGLRLVYSLKNGNNEVATVALDNTMTSGTINLGNGITFEITKAFNGTFKGLPDGNDYKITERVAGYNPEYAETNTDGTVTITNKKDNDNPPPEEPTTPEVVVGGKKFVKTDDNAENPNRLMDARFVVKRENGKKTEYLTYKKDTQATKDQLALETAKTNYLKAFDDYNNKIKENNVTEDNVKITVPNLDPQTLELKAEKTKEVTGKTNILNEISVLRRAYEKAFKTAGTFYEWKEKGALEKVENIKNIVILGSDAEGRFEIQGLAYGDYKLEEIKAPNDFAKISDIEFSVGKGSYDGKNADGNGPAEKHIQYNEANADNNYGQRVVNKKVTIPQTGGMGTVLFTVVGISLMAGAVIAMKRNREEA